MLQMTERESLFFLLGIAASAAVFGAILHFPSVAEAPQPLPPKRIASIGAVELLTVRRVIAAGRTLSSEDFAKILWPHNQVPEGAVLAVDGSKLLGSVSKEQLAPTIPVRWSQLEPAR